MRAAWMISAFGLAANARVARAQVWNDSAVRSLVARAIADRADQGASGGLTDYRAQAHGYLTFLVQAGPGFPDAPRIVRSDELAVEVYWRAPNLSKEIVVGRRDTLLLPVEVGYYDDRFGIIPNNLSDSIRLGDANDVRDVPHPLAPGAPALYDYAIVDSLRLRTPESSTDVLVVRVRPRDQGAARAVGTLYIDRTTGALVHLNLTFTRAAILDRRIETLTVTLDNALVEGRYWLPHNQELEVVRTSTWLNYPIRGIIRARWTVCCYTINRGVPLPVLAGPPISAAPPVVLSAYPWQGRVLDSLPADVRVPTPADVAQAEATAQTLIRQSALTRTQGSLLAAQGISDFARIDRVEGLAVGAGLAHALTSAWTASVRARFGLSDRAVKGEGTVGWQAPSGVGVRLTAYRRYPSAGDVVESSTLANSLAAELGGADRTDPYDARGVEAALVAGGGVRWQMRIARDVEGPLAVHADPAFGRYGPTLPAWAQWATRASIGVTRTPTSGPLGTTWQSEAALQGDWFHRRDSALAERNPLVARAVGSADIERPIGVDRLDVRLFAATVAARGGLAAVPPQDFVFAGGPMSGPGYAYHEFVAQTEGSVHGEWQVPVPFPAINLGRRLGGSTPPSALLAPFAQAVYVDQPASFAPRRAGWYPAVGLGTIAFFGLLRIDIARGLRDGRWTVALDTDRAWWGIL